MYELLTMYRIFKIMYMRRALYEPRTVYRIHQLEYEPRTHESRTIYTSPKTHTPTDHSHHSYMIRELAYVSRTMYRSRTVCRTFENLSMSHELIRHELRIRAQTDPHSSPAANQPFQHESRTCIWVTNFV